MRDVPAFPGMRDEDLAMLLARGKSFGYSAYLRGDEVHYESQERGVRFRLEISVEWPLSRYEELFALAGFQIERRFDA